MPDANQIGAPTLPRIVPLVRADGTRARGVLQRADDQLVRRVVATWVPALSTQGADDASWAWAEKTEHVYCATGVEHVMITHEDDVQAILVTSLPESPPPLSSLPNLLYIEYVAVAPWNRTRPDEPQQFKALGRGLLAYSVRRSIAEGREGRVGLHSEPGAITFYERVCLRRCGVDEFLDSMEYFEGNAAWAQAFLAGR